MVHFQQEKQLIQAYHSEFDKAEKEGIEAVLSRYTTTDYYWRGMHPFYEQTGSKAVAEVFWKPFLSSFSPVQRREDIFFAGLNICDHGKSRWVLSMGNLLGLFDQNWLGIPANGKMVFLPYAEFHRIEGGKIAETAMFCDILSVMQQVGHYPLPPMTGAAIIKPGPRTHDGLLVDPQDPVGTQKTLDVLHQMIEDLNELNHTGLDNCPPEWLGRTWHEDMLWYGPTGIGASYTIKRYQIQHQYPFRENLSDKVFNGHITRFAEGNYCGFFGWPNLNNKNKGGFLGLPASEVHAPMRVVDVYRREGDKLAENWIFIDILYYLFEQGLDVLGRMSQINRTDRYQAGRRPQKEGISPNE
ncbi:MAG: nuclear transport factor 2 family protein [Bacteroidota bacterium]